MAAELIAYQVEDLPTEATFRGQFINIRVGEAPQSRNMLMAGFEKAQSMEALMKREDADPAPTEGEILTIEGKGYKIGTITALLSLSNPAGYRLTISRIL